MTDNKHKVRSLFLTALMVFSVFAGTVALSGTGVAQQAGNADSFPRDSASADSPPTVVYQGETVDISDAPVTNGTGNSIGDGSTTLVGLNGDADGAVESVDASNADFDGFDTGTYSADGDDGADIAVQDPDITTLELRTESGGQGADVTNARITGNTVFVYAEYNFDDADKLSVEVTDEDGIDITGEVLPASDDDGFIAGSARDQELDFSDQSNGVYNITVEGDDFGPSQTVTVTKGDQDVDLTMSSDNVTRGERVTGTIAGAPGETVHARVDADALDASAVEINTTNDNPDASTQNAQDLFRNTGDVLGRLGSEDVANSSTDADPDNYVVVALDLGDSGTAQFSVNTRYLEGDESVTFEAASGPQDLNNDSVIETALASDAEDDSDVEIVEQQINIDNAPSSIAVGSDFQINGTADEIDDVVAYARVDNTWELVQGQGANDNPDSVDSDGSYDLELSANTPLNLPDSYRIGIADVSEVNQVTNGSGTTDSLTSDQWSEIDVSTSTTVRTVEGEFNASLSSETLAVTSSGLGDEITLEGTSIGEGSEVRYYVVGPRGTVAVDGQSISVDDDNTFDQDFGGELTRRGTYQVVAVSQGRDGQFAADATAVRSRLSDNNLQNNNVDVILDEYETAGADDSVVQFSFQAENPTLELTQVGTNGEAAPGDVTIAGESNREDEAPIFIEVLNQNDSVVASGEAEVDGDTSSFEATLDLSSAEVGQDYTVRAEGDESSDTAQLSIVESSPEPDTETATPEPDTETATPEPDMETATATDEPDDETTTGSGPGFGAVAALVGLLAAALLAVRRNN